MIFKQIDELLSGAKTQTRRIVKEGERLSIPNSTAYANENKRRVYTPGNRLKWEVGRTYAIVPKRGAPAIYYKRTPNGLSIWDADSLPKDKPPRNLKLWLTEEGWDQGRIRLTAIRREPLQVLSYEDAVAEGVRHDWYYPEDHYKNKNRTIRAYRDLWESINGAGSWDANPDVWVLEFELVQP